MIDRRTLGADVGIGPYKYIILIPPINHSKCNKTGANAPVL